MKEKLLELAKQCHDDRFLCWWWVKKELKISRYFFHKYCNELVADGKLKKSKGSNMIGYEIIPQNQ